MAKGFYWNKKRVAQAIGKVNAEFLFSAGSFVRNKARSGMKVGRYNKEGKETHAPEGTAPYRYGNQLYDFMLFAFDPVNNTMVIGPKLLGGKPSGRKSTPHILETGGVVDVTFKATPPKDNPGRKWTQRHYAGDRPKLKTATKAMTKSGISNYRYFRSTSAWERARKNAQFLSWCKAQENRAVYETVSVKIRHHPYMSTALKQVLSERVMTRLYQKACSKCYK